jgi:predicted aspartyl protease
VLQRNKAFNGWAFGDAAMQGLRLTGTIGERQIVDLRRGVLWRRNVTNTTSGLSYALGFTGQRFWYSNENGFTVPLVGEGAASQVAVEMVMNAALPLLHGTLRPSATVAGVRTDVVRLEVPNGTPLDAYIEPQSGRLVRAVIDPGGRDTVMDVLGYAELEGKKVVAKWRVGRTTVEMTKVEHATIADAYFRPPSPSAQWTFGPPAPLPISVTPSRIVIEAFVNGAKGRFMLDSGASGIALNSDFADRARPKGLATQTSYGVNGEIRTSLARADTIQVGPHILRNVVVSTGVNVHGRREDFDGLLGFDFLAGALVDVDLAKQTMTIFDPAKYDVTAGGAVVLADLTGGSPAVPVTLDGRVKANMVLDTGDPMAVIASDKLYGPGKVTMRVEGYTNLAGAGGDSQDTAACGHSSSIELGAIRYENVPICFAKNNAIFGSDRGVIGLDFLKHFNLTFDYPNSKLYLTSNGK